MNFLPALRRLIKRTFAWVKARGSYLLFPLFFVSLACYSLLFYHTELLEHTFLADRGSPDSHNMLVIRAFLGGLIAAYCSCLLPWMLYFGAKDALEMFKETLARYSNAGRRARRAEKVAYKKAVAQARIQSTRNAADENAAAKVKAEEAFVEAAEELMRLHGTNTLLATVKVQDMLSRIVEEDKSSKRSRVKVSS